MERVLGVLGGKDIDVPKLKFWASSANKIIAADSGVDTLLSLGISPDLVIGDMDSISLESQRSGIDLLRIDDQNFSDCDKLLHYVLNEGASDIVIAGFEGDRLDHMLGGMSSFLKTALQVRILLRSGIGDVLLPKPYSFTSKPAQHLSALPLLPCEDFTIDGVEWPLKNVQLRLDGQISLSNIAKENRIEISFSKGAVLLFREQSPEHPPQWPSEDTV